jgi:hypothetical protein
MFDGNWLEKGGREVEDEEVLNHVMDKVEQNLKDYIDDLKYEDEIADSYFKLNRA